MSKWISVEDRSPETVRGDFGWAESGYYPVIVKGFTGWSRAKLFEFENNNDCIWRIDNIHGESIVTHWLDITEPPND